MIMTRLGRSRVDMVQPFDLTEVGSAGFSPLQHEFVRDPISRSKSPPEDQDREFVVTCRILAISRVDFTTSTKPVDRNATLPVRRHMSETWICCRGTLRAYAAALCMPQLSSRRNSNFIKQNRFCKRQARFFTPPRMGEITRCIYATGEVRPSLIFNLVASRRSVGSTYAPFACLVSLFFAT